MSDMAFSMRIACETLHAEHTIQPGRPHLANPDVSVLNPGTEEETRTNVYCGGHMMLLSVEQSAGEPEPVPASGSELPKTGGSGTAAYVAASAVLIVVAGVGAAWYAAR